MTMDQQVTAIIVEDDQGSFLLTKRSLKRWGFRGAIMHFKDGRSVLEFLLTANFTDTLKGLKFMILLDLYLPGMTGFELMERFRENPKLRDIPLFVLTIFDDSITAGKCYKSGCDGFFTKPLKEEDFLAIMTDHHIDFDSTQAGAVIE